MGAKSSAFSCQHFTNAISFILFKTGFCILNYPDDLASAETADYAEFTYKTAQTALKKCDIEEAKSKSCPPSTVMIFMEVKK